MDMYYMSMCKTHAMYAMYMYVPFLLHVYHDIDLQVKE